MSTSRCPGCGHSCCPYKGLECGGESVAVRRCEVATLLARHRVNYHHRNVGPEPITAENLRYTSCEGCDWLGGHRDEAGWEGHIAAILTAVPVGVDVEPHEHDAVCMCPTCSSERATYCALTRGADNHQDHQIPTCPKRVISPGSASAPDGA